jgi:NADH-quinone oxidoreductase subunit N
VAFVQVLLVYDHGPAQLFGRSFSIDGLSLFFKLFFILLACLAVVASIYSKEIGRDKRSEYCALVLASTLAMCIAASASDILLAFLVLQFMNILSYFMAAYSKRSILSTEAAVKHFAFGTVAGALFLFGIAILFASTHVMNIYDMHRALETTPLVRETSLVAFMLIFLALCFQLGAFPMYLWTPDVLQGAPTPVSAFLALGPRAAGFAMALRFFVVLFAQVPTSNAQWPSSVAGLEWTQIVALVSGLTMMVGALLAYRQAGAKRLVAYLVVAETGFLLLGLLVLDEIGVSALLYNMVVELFALMGAFYVLSFLFDELKSDRLADMGGMLNRAVPESICLILFLSCIVGLPPMPGFIGKFTLIGAAVRHQWSFLALLAIVARTISVAAVARLSYSLVGDFRVATPLVIPRAIERRVFLATLMAPLLMAGLFAELVIQWAGQSLRFILW